MSTYRDTMIDLPIQTMDGEETLTISAYKITAMRGNAQRTVVTYQDGATIERITVPLAQATVRDLVVRALIAWD